MQRMNLFLAGTSIFFFCAFTCAPQSAAMAQGQEQQTVDADGTPVWDFGDVKEGDAPEHSFILTNDLDNALTIKSIDTSCGCTVVETSMKRLEPGEKAEIKVKFKSKGYSGQVKQFVYVNTDDLDNPIRQFKVTANVVK